MIKKIWNYVTTISILVLVYSSGNFFIGYFSNINQAVADIEEIKFRNRPLFINARIVDVKYASEQLYIKVIAKKQRDDCGPLLGKWGRYGNNDKLVKSFVFISDLADDGSINLPKEDLYHTIDGYTELGWWLIEPLPYDTLILTMLHICDKNSVYTEFKFPTNSYLRGET